MKKPTFSVFPMCSRAWSRPVILIVVLALAALPVAAKLSRAEFGELIDRKVDTTVLMSLVTKYCVDFDIDGGDAENLASQVDKAVVQAIRTCRGNPPAIAPAPAAPRLPAPAAAPLPPGIARYAVVPILVDGEIDLETTSILHDRLREHVKPAQVVDPFTLGLHFGQTEGFHSGASLESLLTAAKAAGASDLVLAKASTYKQFQDYGVRIEADIVSVDDGVESWADKGRGTSGNRSWTAAKKRAIVDLIRKLPVGKP